MRIGTLHLMLAASLTLAAALPCLADNGSYTYSGGSFSVGTSIAVSNATLSATGATTTFSCPVTSYSGGAYQLNWTCAGGTVSIATANRSLVLQGTFLSGAMSFAGGGGGKGGHVSYTYQFSGQFSGTIVAHGIVQAANGEISQYVNTTSQIGTGGAAVTGGSLGWNSAYTPLLVADNANGRILTADNITGANLSAFGTSGSGVGEFTAIAGITEDASSRIYVTDSSLDRVDRFDNLSGTNWISLGSSGAGARQFSAPRGVTIDSAGKIWVADSGNNRIVRMDDMTGANWTSFGTLGAGANQFSAPSAIAFDAQGRIYVADFGNSRIVRMDDLTGKNWVTLNEVLIDPYGYPFYSPQSIAVNAAGQIFVLTGNTYAYLIRCDDMTGANPSVSSWGSALTSMSMDKAGSIYVTGSFTPGLAQVVAPNGAGYFPSGLGGAVASPGPVYAARIASPTPADAVLSASALTFGTTNVGQPLPVQYVVLTNLGAERLALNSISAGPDFKPAQNCGTSLTGGASCSIRVQYDPVATGARASALVVASSGVHPEVSTQLSGSATAPVAVLASNSISFDPQMTATASGAQTVTLTNTGTGPLLITSIIASGDFGVSNTCGGSVPPGNGCLLNVIFKPTAAGARTGAITIADDALPLGSVQSIALSGTGTASLPALTLTPETLAFPEEQIGDTGATMTATLKNNSASSVTLGAIAAPAGFKLATNCGTALANGASCILQAAFSPTVAGPTSGSIAVPVTGQLALSLGLSGIATPANQPPALAANPATIGFGPIGVTENPTLSFAITNTLGIPVAIRSHAFTGASALSLTQYTCPAILAAKASCTAQIMFVPLSTSPYENDGTFTIVEGSGAVTQVPITAQAVANGN